MFYRGNKSIPVFEWNKPLHTYKVQDVAQTLLCDSKKDVCFCTPTNVEHNCTFLVDQSKLKCMADLRADDSGSWKNNGVRCVIIAVNHGGVAIIARDKEAKGYKMNYDQYQLTRTYFIHRTSQDFRKVIFTLFGKLYNFCRACQVLHCLP